MYAPLDVSHLSNGDFYDCGAGILGGADAVLDVAAWRNARLARSGRCRLGAHRGGVALYLMCAFWGFALRGKGTPLPLDPPKKLVVDGPYQVVRNPMYWGVGAVMLGEAAVFHSLEVAELMAALLVGMNLFVLFYEEPQLRRKFGAEYDDYCRRVPRWLPRLRDSRRSS